MVTIEDARQTSETLLFLTINLLNATNEIQKIQNGRMEVGRELIGETLVIAENPSWDQIHVSFASKLNNKRWLKKFLTKLKRFY